MNVNSHVLMQEAKTRVVEVDVVDPSALQRTLSYLYTDMYDDEKLPMIDYVASEMNVLPHGAEGKTPGPEPRELEESAFGGAGAVVSSPQSDAQPMQTDTQDIIECEQRSTLVSAAGEDRVNRCACRKDETDTVCNNVRLRANTLVYILADYCQILELKRLSIKKFAAALEDICLEGFDDICHLVYEVAPPNALDLRLCLSEAIARHGQQLVEDASFMETTLLLPQLLREVFFCIVSQHRTTSAERDAALAASLKAEDEAKAANKKGQEDKQHVIAQVNQARRCRHCSLENNVLFECEHVYLGRSEYSFRCKCRTRY